MKGLWGGLLFCFLVFALCCLINELVAIWVAPACKVRPVGVHGVCQLLVCDGIDKVFVVCLRAVEHVWQLAAVEGSSLLPGQPPRLLIKQVEVRLSTVLRDDFGEQKSRRSVHNVRLDLDRSLQRLGIRLGREAGSPYTMSVLIWIAAFNASASVWA